MGRNRTIRNIKKAKKYDVEENNLTTSSEQKDEILRPSPIISAVSRSKKQIASYEYMCEFDLASKLRGQKPNENFLKKTFSVSENQSFSPLIYQILMHDYLMIPLFLFLNPSYEFTESKIGFYSKCTIKDGQTYQRFFIFLTKNNLSILNHSQFAADTLIAQDIMGIDYENGNLGINFLKLSLSTTYLCALQSHQSNCNLYLENLRSKLNALTKEKFDNILDEMESRFETIILFKLERLFPMEMQKTFRSYVQNTLENNIALLKATTIAR